MMTEKIKEVFNMLEIEPDEITGDMTLEDDIGMDSQELVELHCAIEKVMGIKLPAQFIKKSMTVEELIKSIDNICEGKK